jgi:hypothetical protein
MRGLVVLAAAAVAWPAIPAGAQGEDPPCPPGVAPSATIHARDLEDNGGPLTATHTIALELETSDGEIVNEFEVELPPGARERFAGGPAFQVDAPGPVPVRARWRHYSQQAGSDCTASTEGTVTVGAARRPRYVAPPRRGRTTEIDWYVRFGKDADLRPVELRVRTVRRARLPGPSAPQKTAVYALRRGDRGVSVGGNAERVLRTRVGRFHATFDSDDDIWVGMRGHPTGRRPVYGIDLQLVQAGRLLGRSRLVGRCNPFYCRYRTVSGRASYS